jgi:hypothetical protein
LDPPGPHDHPGGVERQVGRVEEEDLSEMRVERVDPERSRRRPAVALGHGQLQLDAV